MTPKPDDPLGLIRDPYAGDGFVLPPTLCSQDRRDWFKRTNEILGFFMIAEMALKDCRAKFERPLSEQVLQHNTRVRILSSDGRSVITSARRLINMCGDGVEIVARQVFVMLYGSLETFLLHLFERSFAEIGLHDKILDRSLGILMKKKWDGKFCRMREVFGLDYRASHLTNHFRGFGMKYEQRTFDNPLDFLDEMAKLRHRIVHASSILHQGQLIFVNAQMFLPLYGFYALLTDHIDGLFAKRFGFPRSKMDPAKT